MNSVASARQRVILFIVPPATGPLGMVCDVCHRVNSSKRVSNSVARDQSAALVCSLLPRRIVFGYRFQAPPSPAPGARPDPRGRQAAC